MKKLLLMTASVALMALFTGCSPIDGIDPVTVDLQSGTITAGSAGSVSYTVNTANIADGAPVTVTWYSDPEGNTTTTITGITTSGGIVSNNQATVTINVAASVAAGTYYFTVTINGFESVVVALVIDAPVVVKVTGITINPEGGVSVNVGETTTLTASVTPANATNKSVTWSSLHTNVATVDALTGVVTGVSTGTATICATAADESGVTAEKGVTVTSPFPEPGMVFVEGGTFTMGAPDSDTEAFDDERPTHQVTLSSFYIGKYEVTQKEWTAVMGDNPSWLKGDNLPVERVSWNDIVGTTGNSEEINGIRYYEDGFIYKLNAATGKRYRLPTEAEWEYAARGGNQSKGYLYSGSNNVNDVAWYLDNSDSRTREVGTKAPNELGIYDMSGNVWEWCSDLWGYYTDSPKTNPTGPVTGFGRVYRGGSWGYYAGDVRVSCRYYFMPSSRDITFGFRLASSSN